MKNGNRTRFRWKPILLLGIILLTLYLILIAVLREYGQYYTILSDYLEILDFLLILTIGLSFSRLISGTVLKAVGKRVNVTSGRIVSRTIWYILTVIVFLIAFRVAFPSVDLSTLLLGGTVLGIIVGFASQQTLNTLFVSAVILLNQPYKLGESVTIGGNTGTVDDISLFYTTLISKENKMVKIPNTTVFSSVIINHSRPEGSRYTDAED